MTSKFSSNVLRASGLQAVRGQRLLFENISLQLDAASALRIEGENGVGKTTLLRMLVGLGFISQGKVLWNDQSIQDCRAEFNASLHYLGHQTALKLALTPFENLRFLQSFFGLQSNAAEIERALDYFELLQQKDLPSYALSAGQKQRVALARLYLIKRPLWILDEAFTALDINIIARFETLMLEHLASNGSIIFTSHQDLQDRSFEFDRLTLTQGACV